MPVSANVSAGDTVLASQFNNLRTDVLDHPRIEIRKTSDETVSNSTTLQNDDDFSFAVAANEVWLVLAFLQTSFLVASDFKFEWSLPSGGTKDFSIVTFRNIDPSAIGKSTGGVNINMLDTQAGLVSLMGGFIAISSTAGTAQLQWAQNVAIAENTTIEAGSILLAFRVS